MLEHAQVVENSRVREVENGKYQNRVCKHNRRLYSLVPYRNWVFECPTDQAPPLQHRTPMWLLFGCVPVCVSHISRTFTTASSRWIEQLTVVCKHPRRLNHLFLILSSVLLCVYDSTRRKRYETRLKYYCDMMESLLLFTINISFSSDITL